MAYTRPFITRALVSYAGDSRTRGLRLAVRPIDTFTEEPPRAPLRIALKEMPRARAVQNLSGFFCFEGKVWKDKDEQDIDLTYKDGTYMLIVEPDPVRADWYYLEPNPGTAWSFDFTRRITLPMPNKNNPVEEVRLAPNPAYPFANNSTLVRGTVFRGPGNTLPTVPGVVVRAIYQRTDPRDPTVSISHTVETQSDRQGDFVLFFKALFRSPQQVTVHPLRNGQPIPPESRTVTIQEGSTTDTVVLNFPP